MESTGVYWIPLMQILEAYAAFLRRGEEEDGLSAAADVVAWA
jgi:hypothetical protein